MHYDSAEANRKDKREQRKTLRNNATLAEVLLWKLLKRRQTGGWKFRRQQSIGPYILDFYCPELRLGIELDGSSHDHKYEYDEERSSFLCLQGITVIRYQNEQVYNNPQQVADDIVRQYGVREDTDPTPDPSPTMGGDGRRSRTDQAHEGE